MLASRRRVGGNRHRQAHRSGIHLRSIFIGPQAARPTQSVRYVPELELMIRKALCYSHDIGYDHFNHGSLTD